MRFPIYLAWEPSHQIKMLEKVDSEQHLKVRHGWKLCVVLKNRALFGWMTKETFYTRHETKNQTRQVGWEGDV